ncbi:MAG: rhomboid family intramembrane serine protease [Rhodospirillaceae bacterium]|nr:rhomboid family intramembrane serine protease [Rhodospirillaceae bacterium]
MPIIPLRDINKLERIPFQYVTVWLIGACILVYLYQTLVLGSGRDGDAFILGYAMIPAVLSGDASLPAKLGHAPAWATLISYMFLHGGILHIAGNMLFLWVFGDNVEDELGHVKFLLFYFVCGIISALCHLMIDPGSPAPLIGASGAISGVLGAYLVLHPKVPVWVLVFWRIPLRLPAWAVLGFWIGFQVFMVLRGANTAGAGEDSVAWVAHIGGFIAGALLILPLRRERSARTVGRWP